MCLFVDTVAVNEGGKLLYLCEIPFDATVETVQKKVLVNFKYSDMQHCHCSENMNRQRRLHKKTGI